MKIYTLYPVIALSTEGKKSLLYAGIEEEQERAGNYDETVGKCIDRLLDLSKRFSRFELYSKAIINEISCDLQAHILHQSHRGCFQAGKWAGDE